MTEWFDLLLREGSGGLGVERLRVWLIGFRAWSLLLLGLSSRLWLGLLRTRLGAVLLHLGRLVFGGLHGCVYRSRESLRVL